MSFWKNLFSSSETVNKTVDAVINTGDALFFTDEEKSQASQKKLDWVLKYHEASKGSNLARRLLAVMIVGTFLALVVICALLILVKSPDRFEQMFNLVKDTLMQPVSIIIAFYFLSGMVTTHAARKQ